MADLERISISIDADLLARLDALVEQAGHGNRSEAIRDLVRHRLVREVGPDAVVVASLTITFAHSARELSDRLVEAAHDHHELVLSTLHVHLDHDRCMELSALRGTRAQVEHYASHVVGMRGVYFGELVVAGVA